MKLKTKLLGIVFVFATLATPMAIAQEAHDVQDDSAKIYVEAENLVIAGKEI